MHKVLLQVPEGEESETIRAIVIGTYSAAGMLPAPRFPYQRCPDNTSYIFDVDGIEAAQRLVNQFHNIRRKGYVASIVDPPD